MAAIPCLVDKAIHQLNQVNLDQALGPCPAGGGVGVET